MPLPLPTIWNCLPRTQFFSRWWNCRTNSLFSLKRKTIWKESQNRMTALHFWNITSATSWWSLWRNWATVGPSSQRWAQKRAPSSSCRSVWRPITQTKILSTEKSICKSWRGSLTSAVTRRKSERSSIAKKKDIGSRMTKRIWSNCAKSTISSWPRWTRLRKRSTSPLSSVDCLHKSH